MTREEAIRAVDAILDDLCDRRGLRQTFESIDRPIQRQIREAWIEAAMQGADPPWWVGPEGDE